MKNLLPEQPRSRNVIVTGDVSYRAGDGVRLPIRHGLCEMEQSRTDVTLGWQDGKNRLSAVMPQGEFRRYLREGAVHYETVDEAASTEPSSEREMQ
ncbi:MAG TPA: hypothetical protein VLJ57_16470 [Burkholderiaceae bacterium]|nr:hypothetical protein [Burkholderiaceae bacterium]